MAEASAVENPVPRVALTDYAFRIPVFGDNVDAIQAVVGLVCSANCGDLVGGRLIHIEALDRPLGGVGGF